jgi:nitrite reductase/ring-hydroxylating ferredoxin subunit
MAPTVKKFAAGAADDFVVGKIKLLTIGSREIGIVRLSGGAFRAILNRCPHKGAPICKGQVGGTWPPSRPHELDFARDGEVLVCPWHGFEYDLVTGEELYRDRPTRLRMYETSVEDGQVMVAFPERAPRHEQEDNP